MTLAATGAGLAQLVQELSPGGHLVRMRRLRGGLGCRMHVLLIEEASGRRRKLTLRRYSPGEDRYKTPEHAAHEFRLLGLLEEAGIPAPRPILLDAEGKFFGQPAMVLSYLPGNSHFQPRNIGLWVEGLAQALLSVHAVTPNRFDISWLDVNLKEGMREGISRRREETEGDREPLLDEILAIVTDELDKIEWPEPCLVHDDFWPGNTVWYRGRLTGVIDWTDAELGDPRTDVAQCRLDLIVSHDVDVADAFLDAYQRMASRPLPDIWYFDLYRGFGALRYYEHWLKGYHDGGLTHLKSEDVGQRLRAFIRRVLDERSRR